MDCGGGSPAWPPAPVKDGIRCRPWKATDRRPLAPRCLVAALSLCEEPLSSGIRCQTVVLAPPPQPVGDGFTPRGSRVPGLPCSAFGRIFCDHWVLARWDLQARREQWVRGTQPPALLLG